MVHLMMILRYLEEVEEFESTLYPYCIWNALGRLYLIDHAVHVFPIYRTS